MSFRDVDSVPSGVISIDAPILTPKQEQLKWLGEGVQAVEENAAVMRTHISRREFGRVLGSATVMLAELRTDMLAPQYYYELYLRVFDELQHLELYFEEEHSRGRSLKEMYEVVQHTGNIVPRLYLLITVGSVYIKSGEQPAIDIMRDLVEMCKGVQHPIRGLFLRHFLLTMMKNKLPGDSSRVIVNSLDDDGGTVEDTAELILQNFKEMNWLWIRIEAKMPSGVPEISTLARRKQKDRRELCVLVGMNIVRLSQLEGVERQAYKKVIFPRLIEIILKYKEPLAQRYLLEVIVQVFPDEFHLFTLEELFDALENASVGVDICAILVSLMTRLSNYAVLLRQGVAVAGSHKEEKLLRNMFDILRKRIDAIFDANNGKDPKNINGNAAKANNEMISSSSSSSFFPHKFPLIFYLKSILSLVNLSLKVGAEAAAEQIGVIFTSIIERLDFPAKNSVADIIQQIIITVIENLKDPNVVVNLTNIDMLTKKLPFASRRAVAVALCSASVRSVTYRVANFETCTRFFELITPLLNEEVESTLSWRCNHSNGDNNKNNNGDGGGDNNATFSGVLTEQNLVCRVLHLFQCDDVFTQFKLLNGTRKLLTQCGPKHTAMTMPTVASLYIRLALRVAKIMQTEENGSNSNGKKTKEHNNDNNDNGDSSNSGGGNATAAICAKAFNAIHSGNGKGVLEMFAARDPMQTFYLYLTSANAADVCKLEDVAYEHYVSAFQLYEENAVEMQNQIEMVTCLINSLHGVRNMSEENYELLATKICQYSSKLMRKGDQSRLVMLCAQLFWKKSFSEECHGRIVECLRRSLKLANYTQETQQFLLFVELLNYVLHYYAGNAPGVTVNYISALIDILQEKSATEKNNKKNENKNDINRNDEKFAESDSDDNCNFGGNKKDKKDGYFAARVFYRNTARYIRSRQEVEERWNEIDLLGQNDTIL